MRKLLIACSAVLFAVGVTWACCPPKRATVQLKAPCPPPAKVIQAPAPAPMPPPAPVQKEVRVETIPQPPVTVTERTYTVPQPPVQQAFVTQSAPVQTFAAAPITLEVRQRRHLFPLFHRHACAPVALSYGCCGGCGGGVAFVGP